MPKYDNKLTFMRFGPVSGQIQKHTEGNTAPARRGYWAFPSWVPWGRSKVDFYVWHNIIKNYPKYLRKLHRESLREQGIETPEPDYDAWERKMMRSDSTPYFRWSHLKLTSSTELWTHLPAKGHVYDQKQWYKCSVREYQSRIKCLIHQRVHSPVDIENMTEVFIED